MDFSLTKEEVFENSNISLITTRQKRFNNVKFSCEVKDGNYILTSEEGKLSLSIFDEIVLYIIAKYRFCPVWLARQWYESNNRGVTLGQDTYKEKLRSFINFGLIYEFPSSVSVFLMPTDKLASLFNIKLGVFADPPYNTLTHTISEEQVMWEFMSGHHPSLNTLPHFPYISEFGLGEYEKGAKILPEIDYSVKNSYLKKNITEFNDREARLTQEMLEGKLITSVDIVENHLAIYKKVDSDEYDVKVPDLVMLAPREMKDGIAVPCSTAIEVELTNKRKDDYVRLLDLYWDNLKYGHCLYLVSNSKIKDNIINAVEQIYDKHQKDGVEQLCEFEVREFIPPSNEQEMIGVYD